MLKLILNGFFRSGTTVLWKIIRESNPDMHVFYEPLHNELFSSIYREQVLKEMSHGYTTTDEYIGQGEFFLKRLREKHPARNGNMVYLYDVHAIVEYFRIFSNMDKPVVLQPNRLHFMLSDLAEFFDCKVAHIIRHPLDVFLSILFSSQKLKGIRNAFGLNPYLLRLFKNNNPYFLDQQCEFISHYFGMPQPRMRSLLKYIYPKKYYLQKFIFCWTVANWHAVSEVEKSNGIVIRYEDFYNVKTLKTLSDFAKISLEPSVVKIHRNSISKFRSEDFLICYKYAKDMGIHDEFKFVVDKFDYSIKK